MREPESWQPSKYRVDAAGRLRPRPGYVLPGSRFVCQRSVDRLAPLIRAHAVGRLLDCGCGDVPYYALYRDACDAVTCIDWEASSHGARHVDQAVDLNAGLPFADASFDTVLLADVLEHIGDVRGTLARVPRLLTDGGLLAVTVPNANGAFFKFASGLAHMGADPHRLVADLPLFSATPAPRTAHAPDPVSVAVTECDPDCMSPREALDFLYRLKDLSHAAIQPASRTGKR